MNKSVGVNIMDKESVIVVFGASGMVGNAIVTQLKEQGYKMIIGTYHSHRPDFDIELVKLDCTRQQDVEDFFNHYRPEYVFLAAAKVGGIVANNTYKADFIYKNISIATNVIHSAYKFNTKKLLNLGSSCIYPKFAPQPLKEEYLLTGSLEPTNEPYAIAKIAAIKLCRYYNEQYNTNFISVMPTNLYGINDNFDLKNSHVLPALIRKFSLAKWLQEGDTELLQKDVITFGLEELKDGGKEKIPEILKNIYGITDKVVTLWGTGSPKREFLYIDDAAQAALFLMENYNYNDIGEIINIGCGEDLTINDLSQMVKDIVGYKGSIVFDKDKPDGTPQKLLDINRMHKLGWDAKTSLEEGIKKVVNWYREKLQ